MSRPDRLTRIVRALLASTLPDRVAAEAAADLLEDHQRIQRTRGSARAILFVIREGLSLVSNALLASATRLLRSSLLIRRDAWYAIRALTRRPGSSAAAVAMLAAGLAAVAAASGLTSTLLFRPISQTNPDGILRIASVDRAGRTSMRFSEPELQSVRTGLSGAASVAAVYLQPVVIRAGGADMQTLAEVVSGNYFDLIGVDVSHGRRLRSIDAAADAPPVIMISDSLWRSRFGRDPAALGATIRVNGTAFTIVGVATGGGSSSFMGGSVEAWVTIAHAGALLNRDWRTNATDRFWTVLAGVENGRAALDATLARTTADLADQLPDPWRERRLMTLPGTVMAGSQRGAVVSLAIVLGAFAALILAAAVANVVSLLLATAAADRSRIAVLLAIGAGRAAIIRRQLIEGGALGLGAGAVALGLYAWARRQLSDITILPTLSIRLDLPLDERVVTLTVASGLAVGLLLALGPALWSTNLDLAQTLRDGSRGAGGGSGLSRARRLLVAAQVAISLTLLVAATLFTRSVSALTAMEVGFPREGLIALDFDLEPAATMSDLPALARDALARTSALPGVIAAAMSNRAPIDSSTPAVTVTDPGSPLRPIEDVTFYLATAGYFETVGVPIVRGRAITEAEADREADVAVVNETLAARLWPGGDALERALTLQPAGRTVRIIGVARDSKYRSMSEPPRPHLYLPTAPAFGRALLVRTADDPRRTIRAVQQVLDTVGPGVIGFFPRTLEDHLAIDMLPTKAAARAAVSLGALALGLSTAGLYGIVMWFVEIKRREIGVRVALGASACDVRLLVVRQALVAAAPGIAIGLAAAMSLASFGRSLFVGVSALDPWALGFGVGAILMVVWSRAIFQAAARLASIRSALAVES